MNTQPFNTKPYCHRCRTDWSGDKLLAAGEPYCENCRERSQQSLAHIPPIYRKLRPVKPVRFGAGPFLTITGAAGLGKSVAAAELSESIVNDEAVIMRWANVSSLLTTIRNTFGRDTGTSEEKLIREYSGWPLLVLDDIGAEKVSDYTVSTIYQILNTRGEYSRRTIITTNLTLDAIARIFDDRIASRLNRYGTVVQLTKCNVANSTEVKP